MTENIQDKDLEKVNGGYQVTYAFDAGDKFDAGRDVYYYVESDLTTVNPNRWVRAVIVAPNDVNRWINVMVSVLATMTFVGNDKAGFTEAAKTAI